MNQTEQEIDCKKLHEQTMLSEYAADLLICYIKDSNFREQVDAIVKDTSVKATLRGEEIDMTDVRLTAALHKITGQWVDRYYSILDSEDDA